MENQSCYIIKIDDSQIHLPRIRAYAIRFYIVPPLNKKSYLTVLFSYEFIADYYRVTGNIPIEKVFNSDKNKMNFIWWGWKKIEKWYKEGSPSLENNEIKVTTQNDQDWAKDIAKNLDLDKCKELDSEDGMKYSPPPQRIGF